MFRNLPILPILPLIMGLPFHHNTRIQEPPSITWMIPVAVDQSPVWRPQEESVSFCEESVHETAFCEESVHETADRQYDPESDFDNIPDHKPLAYQLPERPKFEPRSVRKAASKFSRGISRIVNLRTELRWRRERRGPPAQLRTVTSVIPGRFCEHLDSFNTYVSQ